LALSARTSSHYATLSAVAKAFVKPHRMVSMPPVSVTKASSDSSVISVLQLVHPLPVKMVPLALTSAQAAICVHVQLNMRALTVRLPVLV